MSTKTNRPSSGKRTRRSPLPERTQAPRGDVRASEHPRAVEGPRAEGENPQAGREHSRDEQPRATPARSGNAARGRAASRNEQNAGPRRRGPTCQAIAKSGARCNAGATARSHYRRCAFHDETISDAVKAEWRTRGHIVQSRKHAQRDTPNPALRDPASITSYMEEISGRVLRGEMSAHTAATLKSLANTALQAYEASMGARLAEVESLLAERKTTPPIVVKGRE